MKIHFLFFALLFSLLTINTTHATPFLYTFEGSVRFIHVYQDPNPSISFSPGSYSVDGVTVNKLDPITYSFVIDLEREGLCSPEGSSQCNFSGGIPRDETGSDYFYVGLGAASIEIPIDFEGTDFNYGLIRSNSSGQVLETTLNAGSAISIKTSSGNFPFPLVSELSKDITLWDTLDTPLVTDLVGMDNWNGMYDGDRYIGTMYSFLDLVSIEPIAIPEPSIWLMMLFGFLLYFCRRPKKFKLVSS